MEIIIKNKIYIILFLIIVLGCFLRFYKLGEQPFVTDEFLDINAAYGYYKTGEWKAWDFNLEKTSDNLYEPRDERAWIYRWQVAQLFKFLPPTEAVARSVSALWGIVSIFALYLVSVYFTRNKIIGLISAFLYAVSASGIFFDRMLRMYAMFFPIFLLFSWFLFRFYEETYTGKSKPIKFIQKKTGINAVWFFPAVIFGLLSFHLHPLALNMGVIFFIYLVICGFLEFCRKRSFLNKYTVTIFLILATLLLLYINNPKLYSFYSKSNPVALGGATWSYFTAAVSDYSNSLVAYGLMVAGFVVFRKKDKALVKGMIWLGCCFFTTLLAAVFFWNENFGLRFIFFVMSFGIILLSSGIYFLADRINEYFPNQQNKVFVGVLLALLLTMPNYAYFFSTENPYRKNKEKTDYRAAFRYFMENKNKNDVLIARNFRNYYYKNAGAKVVNKEWKKKISQTDIEKIISENPSGWIVTGDFKDEYDKEAQNFVENGFNLTRDMNGVKIYRWPNQKEKK